MMLATGEGIVIYPVVVDLVEGIKCRTLLDTGAGSSYASAALLQHINKLPVRTEHKRIDMMMCCMTQRINIYDLTVKSVDRKFELATTVNKVDKGILLTVPNPSYAEKIKKYCHLDGVVMEDKDPKSELPIYMIFGANVLGLEDKPEGDQQIVYDEFIEQLDQTEDSCLGETSHFEVDPAGPMYKVFHFAGSLNTVRVEATSDTDYCAIISIQNTQCPVYDLARNVEFTGYYQTITKKAAITVQKQDMDQFYIVVIVKPTDTECETGYRSTNPIAPEQSLASPQDVSVTPDIIIARKKVVSIKIVRVESVKDHINAIMFPIIVFGMFYFTTFLFIVGSWCK
ncbi:hypothetical protein QZH41_004027 [Actinostola sp. cb2023]|nr:hypothetical protein QZH41_004027 [Actinostola sp. cb2023]